MARPKLPIAYADVTGATVRNPGRYTGAARPALEPLGEPYEKLTPQEKKIWGEFRAEIPWLRKSDRPMTAIACSLIARSEGPEGLPITGQQILRRILNSFGGSPTSPVRRRFMGD